MARTINLVAKFSCPLQRIKGNQLIKRAFEIITFLTGMSLILKVVLSP